MIGDNLIKLGELAGRLQVSTVTVRTWMDSGKIPKSSYIAVAGDSRTTYRFDYDKVREHLSADNTEGRKQLELDFGEL